MIKYKKRKSVVFKLEKMIQILQEEIEAIEEKVKESIEKKKREKKQNINNWIELTGDRMQGKRIHEILYSIPFAIFLGDSSLIRKITDGIQVGDWILENNEVKHKVYEKVKNTIEGLSFAEEAFYIYFLKEVKQEKERVKDVVSGNVGLSYVSKEEQEETLNWFKKIFLESLKYYLGFKDKEAFLKNIYPYYEKIFDSKNIKFNPENNIRDFVSLYSEIENKEVKKKIKHWYQKKEWNIIETMVLLISEYDKIIYVLNEEQINQLKEIQKPYFEREIREIMKDKEIERKYEKLKVCKQKLLRVQNWKESNF